MEKPVETIFAHTLGRADLIGGVVRCEWTILVPDDQESESPRSVTTHALIMPVDGFLRAFTTLEAFVHKLTATKGIGPQEERGKNREEKNGVHLEEPSGGMPRPPTSPNFM
ncbi:MAG: hypothetical protein HQL98_06785 [Magnetococcales bacterium]|nr:hypothetical protein [Magnetococcales bacterium]